ncbi:MAG: type I-U CRISPR-associated RAMP protein Csb1/Cas7u [Gemmataceae bacterium]
MSKLSAYDAWLDDEGPAALVIREHLVPVEGPDGVFFPATFAAGEGFPGGYNIDVFPSDADVATVAQGLGQAKKNYKPTIEQFPAAKNVCLVDSVGSQANRIEPLFAREKYKGLVPQVVVTVNDGKGGEKSINLLDAGHRAGDALIRSTRLHTDLEAAFKASLAGDDAPLARISPTSLVFGVWDSRNTQAKRPRLVSSTIRAYDVRMNTRSAVYIPPLDYAALDVFSEEERAKAERDAKNPLAIRGFVHVPASGSHGGVTAVGGIRRDATLSLAALRLLAVREANGTLSTDRTQALRRYILGLALVALTAPGTTYLRAGCNLVPDVDMPRGFTLVGSDGTRTAFVLTHPDALAFATVVAQAFRVGPDRTEPFAKDLAKKDVKPEDGPGKKKRGKPAKESEPAAGGEGE